MEDTFCILLVDDQPDFLEPIAFWLESKGYRVKTASHGREALEIIKQEVPNVVFLDIQMPVMDGIETLRRIRKITNTLPVIMITAVYKDEEKFSTVRNLGISGFFPKKGDLKEIEKLLEPILKIQKRMNPSV